MPANDPASRFITASIEHPTWLEVIQAGPGEAVVQLARDNGFECSLDDLKQAARELLPEGHDAHGAGQPDAAEIDEAASGMSDLETDTGYGNDTGYAALFGVAGTILKL